MSEPFAYFNGSLVPQSEAFIPLNDAGFIYGATVTDLCRTFRHELYRWQDHLDRFRASCQATSIGVVFSEEAITTQAHEVVERNAKLIDAKEDLALVMFATPGPVGYYLGQSVDVGVCPTFCMHTFPLPFQRYRPWIETGVRLVTPTVRQVPGDSVRAHVKHRSRIHYWMAGKEVGPDAQALLLDRNDNVTETASSNFLLVKNGTIISPPLECILPGISLNVVAQLCKRLGVPFTYRRIALEECYSADEALLTCTSYCIAGVRQINGHAIPWPGPILGRLVAAWSDDVGMGIHAQILTS